MRGTILLFLALLFPALANAQLGLGGAKEVVTPVGANGFSECRPVKIDHTKIPSDQVDFPVIIKGTTPYLAHTANGGKVTSTTGDDILFFSDAAATVQLDHHKRDYDPADGVSRFVTRWPLLSSTIDNFIYMCYGKASITASQENIAAVYTSHAHGIYPLDTNVNDVSQDANHGTNNGTTTTAGQMDGAANFVAASSQYIDLGNPAWMSTGSSFTISLWYHLQTMPGSSSSYILYRKLSSLLHGIQISVSGTPGTGVVVVAGAPTNTAISIFEFTTAAAGDTKHVTVTWDSVTSALTLYVNGVIPRDVAYAGSPILAQLPEAPADNAVLGWGFYLNGWMDEVKIYDQAKNAGWVAIDYDQQRSPELFTTIGDAY